MNDFSTDFSVTFDPTRDLAPAASFEPSTDFAAALDAIAPTLPARIEAAQMPGEDWLTTLQRLLPTIAMTYQQAQLLKVQTDRAKAGLPPLDMRQYGVGVNVGMSPETRNMVMIGGAALLAVLFLGLRKGR